MRVSARTRQKSDFPIGLYLELVPIVPFRMLKLGLILKFIRKRQICRLSTPRVPNILFPTGEHISFCTTSTWATSWIFYSRPRSKKAPIRQPTTPATAVKQQTCLIKVNANIQENIVLRYFIYYLFLAAVATYAPTFGTANKVSLGTQNGIRKQPCYGEKILM